MNKFQDEWVVDRTLFEYFNQGGCSCCGISHAMMDLSSFMQKCSDWETDDQKKEQQSPWPGFIHDEVLADRIKIRMCMKQGMGEYKRFLQESRSEFHDWWKKLERSDRSRLLQTGNVSEEITTKYDIKSSYSIVLCAVLEQLKTFAATGYTDSRSDAESVFENHLVHHRGGFTVSNEYLDNEQVFLDMFDALQGPKLLPVMKKSDKAVVDPEESGEAPKEGQRQSFRSDRRIVRLVRHHLRGASIHPDHDGV